jgi:Conjugal transfer protein TraD
MALLMATEQALVRNTAARRRAESGQRRTDTREWVVERRERTRHLIELGGLVQKSGLVDLAGDDRATLYGAMLDLAGRAGDGDGANALALWKRRGKRAFDAEAEAAETAASANAPAKED